VFLCKNTRGISCVHGVEYNLVLNKLSSNEDFPHAVSPTQRILKTKPSDIALAMI
jgi:hypothetical protein